MSEELLAAGVRLGTPILLVAAGEILTESSGVVNVGVEGMMLAGAFAGAIGALATGSSWSGLVVAAAAGALLALVFALLVVGRGGDPVVTGTGINLLALGLTGFAYQTAFGRTGTVLAVPRLEPLELPLLSGLPWVGRALFAQPATTYLAYATVVVLALLLARTALGLRIRATGSAPHAVTAAGASVSRLRVGSILAGGMLAGLGGGALALAHAGTFVEGMTAGRGFIALAVVICARANPWGALAASVFFGTALALQYEMQALGVRAPYQLVRMIPYVATLVVLALLGRRGRV